MITVKTQGNSAQQQTGAVLVFCLVFLLVLTIMSTNSVESALLESRMATSMYQHQSTVSLADAVLRVAEQRIMSENGISGTVKSEPEKYPGSTIDVSYRIVRSTDQTSGNGHLSTAWFDIVVTAGEQRAEAAVRLQSSLYMQCEADACRYTRKGWRLTEQSWE